MSFETCTKCGGKAFRDKRGKLLRHTTAARGGRDRGASTFYPFMAPSPDYVPARVCE